MTWVAVSFNYDQTAVDKQILCEKEINPTSLKNRLKYKREFSGHFCLSKLDFLRSRLHLFCEVNAVLPPDSSRPFRMEIFMHGGAVITLPKNRLYRPLDYFGASERSALFRVKPI